jgi:hypothetical protein
MARKEIFALKDAIDNFQEGYEDLNSVFFILPNNKDFTDTTRELENL